MNKLLILFGVLVVIAVVMFGHPGSVVYNDGVCSPGESIMSVDCAATNGQVTEVEESTPYYCEFVNPWSPICDSDHDGVINIVDPEPLVNKYTDRDYTADFNNIVSAIEVQNDIFHSSLFVCLVHDPDAFALDFSKQVCVSGTASACEGKKTFTSMSECESYRELHSGSFFDRVISWLNRYWYVFIVLLIGFFAGRLLIKKYLHI